jgi:hypothetical protein
MPKLSKEQQIQARRKTLENAIAKSRATIAAMEAKLAELEIAERVIASLDDEGDSLAEIIGASTQEESTGKPSGTPTMTDMIIEALQDARRRGAKGLEPKEMVDYIAKKWWPNVPSNAVGPIAWRMQDRGELRKRDSRYFLPKQEDNDESVGGP